MYELLLTSIAIAGGYWGQHFLRRRPHGTATFGLMQLAMAALAALGIWNNRGGPAIGGLAGAIALGMGAILLLVGPLVRGLARRAAVADHLTLARRLLSIAEVLNPGSGVTEEKQLLGTMAEIREGNIDRTIEALSSARAREGREARRAIDERIAMLYVAAYRWQDAIAHAEARLLAEANPRRDAPDSLRDALGLAPPVWVELIGAYGRVGDLDRAAGMLARLEDACAGRDGTSIWLHRARMMFLALAGRPAAVEAMVARDKARHMSDAARSYWVAVAHEHTGDRAAATAAYQRARARAKGKPREMIDKAVAALAGELRAPALSDAALAAIARAEAAPIPATPAPPRAPRTWAAASLTAACVVAAIAIAVLVGPSQDLGVLVRAGASVRGLVGAGEWWRLVACVFVHVGVLHLIANAIGLYFIGRLAESLFGGPRVVAIFGIAGVAGAVASYTLSTAGVSAGASGAIFGLLGAVFLELTLHRAHYRAAWKRGVWGSLAVVTIAQIGVDFAYPIIDQWAHGAGLVAGALAGAALSPRVRWARVGLWVARVVAVGFAAVAVVAAILVAATPLAASVERAPMKRFAVGALAITAPSTWRADAQSIADPDELVIGVMARVEAPAGVPALIAEWTAGEPDRARARGFDAVDTAPAIVPLPAGWTGSELVVSLLDGMEYRQEFRAIVVGRAVPGTRDAIVATFYVPDHLARAMPAELAALVGSIAPR